MEGQGIVPKLTGENAMNWCYRGEGAANIVLAYQGSDPLFLVCSGSEQEEIIVPSISIEIKPKCGFLPSSALIAAENCIKKKVSRFTMHQFLKLSEGQVKALSHYSPLDLFSGNLEKINQALHNLFDNPQNNLRVFIGGSLVDTTMSDLNVEPANWQILREALKSCICSDNQVDLVEVMKELVAQSLYETDVLKNLLAAQKLDTCDIEGAIHAYHKLWDDYPAECLNGSIMKTPDGSIDPKAGGFLDGKKLSESNRIVRDYLIAATAKDCSIMLTFEQAPDTRIENATMQCHKLVCSSKTGKFFRSKIRFVDLDLKRLGKMPHYLHVDQEIVRTYLTATNGGGPKCCDVPEGKLEQERV